MNTYLRLIVGVSILAPVFIFGNVLAVSREDGSRPGRSNARETRTVIAQQESPAMTTAEEEADNAAKLKERLEARKAALKIRLSNAELLRLKSRCKASQGQLRSLSGRISGIETSRTVVYDNLVTKLNKLSVHVKEKGADTAELDSQITVLQEKITAFTADLHDYKQTVSDLAEMNCAADALAFKASLEWARAAREKAAQSALDIRSHLNGTIKPALVSLRQQLAGSADTDSREGDQ